MKKIIIISVIAILVVLSAFTINYLSRLSEYKEKISNIVIDDIKLVNKEDGKYVGEFDADMISAKVEVHIKNKKLSDIYLIKHKNERGAPAEVITKKIIEKQSLKVDTISGATNSSKVIIKAIENALNNEKV